MTLKYYKRKPNEIGAFKYQRQLVSGETVYPLLLPYF